MRAGAGLLACALSAIAGAWFSAEAQPAPPRLVPDCGGTFGLCGFRDRATKAEVIPRRFERVFPFSEGLAAVRLNGRYGYIDERGEQVIQPGYDLAGGFYQGLAEVLIGDKTGVIDRQGRVVVAPQFAHSIPFTSEVVLAQEGTWKSTQYQGREELFNLSNGRLPSAGEWGLFHIRNGWVTKPEYHVTVFEKTGRGLIWAATKYYPNGPFGLLRADGTWQVEPEFMHVQPLMDGRAVVDNGQRLRGAVDPDGKLVVPYRYRMLGYWANGSALTRDGDKEGLVDKAGNLIGGRLFDRVERAETGDISRVMFDGNWHGLDRQGNLVPDPQSGTMIADCPEGLRVVKRPNGIQVVDQQGRPTIPYLLDERRGFPFSCDRPTVVKLGAKWGYIRQNGKLLFDPPPFDNLYDFQGDYAIVIRDGKHGLIDSNGRFMIEPQLDQLQYRGESALVQAVPTPVYQVKNAGREYFVSPTGQEVAAPQRIDNRARYLECSSGSRLVSRTGSLGSEAVWGIADADGREIIRPQFRAVHCFQNGVAWAPMDAKRQWCPVGPDGTVRTQPACVTSRYPYIQTHHFPERFVLEEYENSVLWTRAYLEYGAGRRDTPPRMIGDGVMSGVSSSIFR
jgi:hypothetical protein